MSLNVSVHLLEQAQSGNIDETEFVETIRESLPYAWSVVSGLVEQVTFLRRVGKPCGTTTK